MSATVGTPGKDVSQMLYVTEGSHIGDDKEHVKQMDGSKCMQMALNVDVGLMQAGGYKGSAEMTSQCLGPEGIATIQGVPGQDNGDVHVASNLFETEWNLEQDNQFMSM